MTLRNLKAARPLYAAEPLPETCHASTIALATTRAHLPLPVCACAPLGRHSVTSAEVLSVLAAPDEYELERGVWYLLEAPSTLAVSHSACVLSARFGLSDDDLFNLLQPAAIPDFRIAKESTWRAAFTKAGLTAVVFKPEQEERKIASYGRLRYMQYRLESAEYIV